MLLVIGLPAGVPSGHVATDDTPCRSHGADRRSTAGSDAGVEPTAPSAVLSDTLLPLWKELDLDDDGDIDDREAAVEPQVFACFAALDGNTDSVLEPAEFADFTFIYPSMS